MAEGVRGRLLTKIFVSKVQDVRGGWRKLRNGECHDSHSSSYLRSMRWVGHVVRMEEKRRIFCGNLKERDILKDIGVDRRKILKYM